MQGRLRPRSVSWRTTITPYILLRLEGLMLACKEFLNLLGSHRCATRTLRLVHLRLQLWNDHKKLRWDSLISKVQRPILTEVQVDVGSMCKILTLWKTACCWSTGKPRSCCNMPICCTQLTCSNIIMNRAKISGTANIKTLHFVAGQMLRSQFGSFGY